MITDEGVRHVGSGACAADSLAILELDNCPLISDAALDHLTSCAVLQRVEVYDCQLITRAGIRRLKVLILPANRLFLLAQKMSPWTKCNFSTTDRDFFNQSFSFYNRRSFNSHLKFHKYFHCFKNYSVYNILFCISCVSVMMVMMMM